MKRKIAALIICLYAASAMAQDMKTVFVNIPDMYIPQLEIAWRKDIADLFLSGKTARLQNTMNGYSQMINLTADYLRIQTTERTLIDMKLLPLVNDTYIICMITTVSGPAPDSRIEFYTTEWKRLDKASIFSPVPSSAFIRDDADKNSDSFKDAMAYLDVNFIRYSLNPDNDNLTAEYTTPLYLSSEVRSKISPFIKEEPKIYLWKRGFFEP